MEASERPGIAQKWTHDFGFMASEDATLPELTHLVPYLFVTNSDRPGHVACALGDIVKIRSAFRCCVLQRILFCNTGGGKPYPSENQKCGNDQSERERFRHEDHSARSCQCGHK